MQGKTPAAVQSAIDGFVTEATMFLLAEVKKRTPQGASPVGANLLASELATVSGKGTPLVKGEVASAHQYAEVIEKGRTAGKAMPPAGVLVRWLEVKLGLDVATAKRVEFVVRRKIGKKGFPGRHMFEKSVTENQGALDAMAERYGLMIATELQ
jgi:hypothetical protein